MKASLSSHHVLHKFVGLGSTSPLFTLPVLWSQGKFHANFDLPSESKHDQKLGENQAEFDGDMYQDMYESK